MPLENYFIDARPYGALVSDGEHQFVVAPKETPKSYVIWSDPSNENIPGVYSTKGEGMAQTDDAEKDFRGKANTAAIMKWVEEGNGSRKAEAAKQAVDFRYNDIDGWWLPSAGELNLIMNKKNVEEINKVFKKCSNSKPLKRESNTLWSSTQKTNTKNNAVFIWYGEYTSIFDDYKNNECNVRPVTEF